MYVIMNIHSRGLLVEQYGIWPEEVEGIHHKAGDETVVLRSWKYGLAK